MKEIICIKNGIVICETYDFYIMIHKIADIINTNVILETNTPFFQNLKLLIIIFECNGFMQLMCVHINWVYT